MMRRFVSLLCVPLLAAPQAPAPPGPVILTHANVVDVIDGRTLRDATVLVVGGKIARVAEGGATVPAPEGAQTIDLGGRWVVPGLIDAHTHITTMAAARRALESGVTTARSAGTPNFQDVGLRALARSGAIAGPELLAAGVAIRPDEGEALLGDPRFAELAGGVSTPEQLRLMVQVDADRGADVIKILATERAGLPNTDPRKQTFTEAQLRVVVEAAAARGLAVMCHAHGDEGARAAVRAGVRSIEHGTYLSDSTLALMKQKGTYFVPTYSTVVDLTEPGGDYDDPVLRLRGAHMLPRLREAVQHAHRMGVKIVTGGDTGYGPESVTRVSHEAARLVDLGLTPLEALRAATTVAAELLGVSQRTGAVRAGMEADLIVVERNPLEEIGALQDVLVVMSDGRVAVNRLPFEKR